MKIFTLILSLLFLVQCTSMKKASYDSVVDKKTAAQKDILQTLRDISSISEDDLAFLSDKMKSVLSNYKIIEKKLIKIEKRLDDIITEISNLDQKTEDSKRDISSTSQTSIVEIDHISDEISLFKEDFNQENSDKDSSKTETEDEDLKSDLLKEAEDLYQQKEWQSAISKFQQYRDENPDSASQAKVTFYIAESFRQLKMLPESQVFYKEVVEKYPDSSWANQSKIILENK